MELPLTSGVTILKTAKLCYNSKTDQWVVLWDNITEYEYRLLLIQFLNDHNQWVYSGALVLTGCTNAYVLIECPMDDTVEVTDVRITSPQKGSPCAMTEPDFFFWKVRQSYMLVFTAEELCSHKTRCHFKYCIFTARKLRKVMFSEASVSHSVHG